MSCMSFPRAAGILLHPTSLPSRGGIGDFGPAAYQFAILSPRPARDFGRFCRWVRWATEIRLILPPLHLPEIRC
jgi:hypothetical protein